MMFDMLFVLSSHSLAESIYLLDNHCKQFTDKERVEVQERINPELRCVFATLQLCFCLCEF